MNSNGVFHISAYFKAHSYVLHKSKKQTSKRLNLIQDDNTRLVFRSRLQIIVQFSTRKSFLKINIDKNSNRLRRCVNVNCPIEKVITQNLSGKQFWCCCRFFLFFILFLIFFRMRETAIVPSSSWLIPFVQSACFWSDWIECFCCCWFFFCSFFVFIQRFRSASLLLYAFWLSRPINNKNRRNVLQWQWAYGQNVCVYVCLCFIFMFMPDPHISNAFSIGFCFKRNKQQQKRRSQQRKQTM